MNKLTGLIGTLLLAVCAPLAHADYVINYEIGAGPVMTCADDSVSAGGLGTACAISSGGVTANVITGTSNSPGTPAEADQEGSTTKVQSTTAATLTIWFTSQDFTEPTAPPTQIYESSLEVTTPLANTTSTAVLQSCVDNTNGVAPALGCTGGSLTNLTVTLSGAGSPSPNTVFGVANAVATYSLEQALTLTLVAGSNITITTSQSLTPVPEPASLMLLGSGLLGAGFLLRRKMRVNSKRA